MTKSTFKNLAASFLLLCGTAGTLHAGPIISPVSAVINASGPGFGSIADTLNQAGLLSGFVSGVTDFDTYVATNPQHSSLFAGFEWFGNSGTSSAKVTYDLGAVMIIDRIALWNEESSGIGQLVLDAPGNAGFLNAFPTDNPLANYGVDVFTFAPITTQFVTFNMSGCPQFDPGTFPSCAIGEVAFRKVGDVPEPSTIALIAMALLSMFGLGMMRRRAEA